MAEFLSFCAGVLVGAIVTAFVALNNRTRAAALAAKADQLRNVSKSK